MSVLSRVGNYLSGWLRVSVFEDDVVRDEKYLSRCLDELEAEDVRRQQKEMALQFIDPETCPKQTGKVTLITDSYGMIDDTIRFSVEGVRHLNISKNDIVTYFVFKTSPDKPLQTSVKVLNIIKSYVGNDDSDANRLPPMVHPTDCEIKDKVIVGKVTKRDGRNVVMEPNDITFSMDDVVSNFVPVRGDWIQISAKMAIDPSESFPKNDKILEVTSLSSLRSKTEVGFVTHWEGSLDSGLIDNQILFMNDSLKDYFNVNVGDKVAYDAIESDQGRYSWRALSVTCLTNKNCKPSNVRAKKEDANNQGISLSNNFKIDNITIGDTKYVNIEIKNVSEVTHLFDNVVFLSKLENSQIRLFKTVECNELKPGNAIILVFECCPKFFGLSDEIVIFSFRGFEITKIFKINVTDPKWKAPGEQTKRRGKYGPSKNDIENLKNVKFDAFFPGIRPMKPPPFVTSKLPNFPIPVKFKDFVYNCYIDGTINDHVRMSNRKEIAILSTPLSIKTYKERFRHLLFLEEIHQIMQYRKYDMAHAFMTKVSDFLTLQIENLFERRPSLQIGDFAMVGNPWNSNERSYQGFVHKIVGDGVYLKFSEDFRQKYNGEDLSVQFFFGRTSYNKCHFSVDLAYSHFGASILFPDRIHIKKERIAIYGDSEVERTESESDAKEIIWCDKRLNVTQKRAVLNVLRGNTRPLPYIIFGPPGTGKTITLIEVILQLIFLMPDSRLLIATPSNSASNLIVERLLDVHNFTPGFLIRLIANSQVVNDKVPDRIKPYCATVNISMENTNKSTYHKDESGIHMCCGKTFIGRHRVTIGTCMTLGNLATLGFPSDHFTHILIDEAGQATEPEMMIPLSLIDKNVGQIILAGDPFQLGPVVTSPAANKLGLQESFMERLLACGPYQKDAAGHGSSNNGYDPRVVTQLTHNYRAIERLLTLTSKYFYNDALVCRVDKDRPDTKEYIEILKSAFKYDTFPGVVFHGIRGSNLRGEEDPSWFNPQEAAMVLMTLCKLYKNDISPEDIGIITPYAQQVRHIKFLIGDMGIVEPKVASIEEFQGQERKIIIMSTVRSDERYMDLDVQRNLGFVNNRKRVNVALSRAQIMLIIFGNPHILSLDPLWCDIIKYIMKNGCYQGCNLPNILKD